MIASITHNSETFEVNLNNSIDLSIPLIGGKNNLNAWNVASPKIAPHIEGDFIGKVGAGASVNFNNISFNPHAHVTHTECLGHITSEFYSVNQCLTNYFFLAELITVTPEIQKEDEVITRQLLQSAIKYNNTEALIIRTLPNAFEKRSKQYAHTNPPYLNEAAMQYLVSLKINHLLVDLPSVDKEKDGGALVAHKTFWNVTTKPRINATITEFVYVPDAVADGYYLLNLQTAAIENDASPSRPVLYQLEKK